MENIYQIVAQYEKDFRERPVKVVEGYEFKGLYLPCANVSGDFYDFIQVNEHEIGIAMGDHQHVDPVDDRLGQDVAPAGDL